MRPAGSAGLRVRHGVRAPVRLNAPLGNVAVSPFRIAADGESVVFRAGGHLFGTPIGGGEVVQISDARVVDVVLQRFEIAPDSSSVAFAAIGTGSSRRELYYAPLDASETL